jgi:Rrf2 family protein
MKTDYALRALFTLVEHYGRGPIPIRELARRNDVPKRFLEQIMLELKSRGWVDSMPGKLGGYVLAKDPEQITLGQVVRHFDGVLAPMSCVSVSHYERCSQEPVCRFRRVLLEVRNVTHRLMDQATLARVFAGEPVRAEEVFDPLLLGGEGIGVFLMPVKTTESVVIRSPSGQRARLPDRSAPFVSTVVFLVHRSNRRIFVRPHDFDVALSPGREPGIPGEVRKIHAAGPRVKLAVQTTRDETIEVVIAQDRFQDLRLAPGSPCFCDLERSRCLRMTTRFDGSSRQATLEQRSS